LAVGDLDLGNLADVVGWHRRRPGPFHLQEIKKSNFKQRVPELHITNYESWAVSFAQNIQFLF
jgi:hypothetical protein